MPSFKIRCTDCTALFQVSAYGGKTVKVACPKCKRVMSAALPSRTSDTQPAPKVASKRAPVANAPQQRGASKPASAPEPALFDFSAEQASAPLDFDPLGTSNDAVLATSGASYYTPVNTKRKRAGSGASANARFWLVPGGIAAGVLLLTIIFFASGGFRRGGMLSRFGNGVSQLLSLDSKEAFYEDLLDEGKRVELYGPALRENGGDAETLERLRDEVLVFQAMVSRAANLPVEHISAEKFAEQREEFIAAVERAKATKVEERKQQDAERLEKQVALDKNFWGPYYGSTDFSEPVVEAIGEVKRWRDLASVTASLARSYPDPRDDPPMVDSWTEKDRLNLSAYHAASELNREFFRELAANDLRDLESVGLSRLYSFIDDHAALASELAVQLQVLDKKSLGWVPRTSPYENCLETTSAVAEAFSDNLREDLLACPQLAALLKDQRRVSRSIENLNLSPTFRITGSSRERCEEYERESIEEQNKAELAEAARIAAEKAKAQQHERERVAKAARDEAERIRREEEAANIREENQKRAEEAANARQKMQEAPKNRRDRLGPGGNGVEDRRREGIVGPPSGFGQGPLQTPGNRGQRPPSDPAKLVAINVTGASRITPRSLADQAPAELRAFGMSVSSSGSSMTIKIHNYDQPLETLAALLPELEFTNIDNTTRKITAIEKAE